MSGKRTAIKFGTWDSNISLCFAFFVNAAILIVAGAAFFYGPSGGRNVAYISDAYRLIAPAVRSVADADRHTHRRSSHDVQMRLTCF
jgi:Mn2+/Fe2+ NRAMP family transporter